MRKLPFGQAIYFANLSRAAYHDHIEPLTFGAAKVIPFDQNGTQAFVLDCNDAWRVVFRGTEPASLLDLRASLQCAPTDSGVHSGVALALDKVWGHIAYILQASPRKRVQFCGHSLGGALAIEAGRRWGWLVAGNIVASDRYAVHAYGAPKVFTTRARFPERHWYKRCWLYINHNDAVTRMPPRSLGWVTRMLPEPVRLSLAALGVAGGKYRRLGRVIYFNGARWIPAPNPARMARQYLAALGSGSLDDHGIDNYITALRSQIPQPPTEGGA